MKMFWLLENLRKDHYSVSDADFYYIFFRIMILFNNMKKIILLFVLTLLTIINSDIKAITNEQLLIDAAKATIEKARVDGTGLFFNSNVEFKITKDSYSPKTTDEQYITSALSNMRAQAELYYANNNNYGKTTQSCSAGIFSSKDQGLLKLLIDTFKKTSVVNCSSNSTSWAVSAKISDGKYWCVDNSGYSKSLGAILKKGLTSCNKGVKSKVTTDTNNISTSFSIFPKSGKIYDLLYKTDLIIPKDKYNSNVISKDDVSYELITKNSLSTAGINDQASIGKYLIIPNNASILSQYESLNGTKIDKIINSILGLDFKVKLIKTNADGGVYEVTVSYIDFSHKIAPIYSKLNFFMSSFYHDIYNLSKTFKINVVVKNGLINSIYGSNNVKSDDSKINATIDVTANVRQSPTISVSNLNTITCEQLFGKKDGENVCTPNYINNSTEILIQDPAILEEQSKKGKDAALQSYLSSMRAQAELYYANNNNYGITTSSCLYGIFSSTATGGLGNIVSTALGKTGDMVCNATTPDSNSKATAWLVSAKLNTGPWYCVDSTGVATTIKSQKTAYDTKCQ